MFTQPRDNMRLFYTYIWRDRAGVPFYVGKGVGKRAYNTTSRSDEFKEIYALGGCSVSIVDEFVLEYQAFAHEVELIAMYGRRELGGLLVNKTDGGEGASGGKHTDDARRKIGAASIGNTHTRGRKLSREHVAALVSANIGNKYTLGRKLSDEHRFKIGLGLLGNRHMVGKSPSIETRGKLSRALIGRPKSAESRVSMSKAQRGRTQSPETRAKLSALNTGKSLSQEHRTKVRDGLRRSGPRRGGYKGVSVHKASGRWTAALMITGKSRYLGIFQTPVKAAQAYDAAAIAAFGVGNCYLNFPPETNDNRPESIAAAG